MTRNGASRLASLTEMLTIRLSKEDCELLEQAMLRLPLVRKSDLVREAIRRGLKALQDEAQSRTTR